ncbi:MAG: helix-turn-helix domain-containing protein [Mangrovicoccus sp.]
MGPKAGPEPEPQAGIEIYPVPKDGFLQDPRRPLGVRIAQLQTGRMVAPHAHPRGQLTLVYDGVVRLRVGEDVWFVPGKHGIWIPPDMPHQLSGQRNVEIHHLFVDPRFVARLGWSQPEVVVGSPLLRGIARRLAPGAVETLSHAEARRLAWVALDEMGRLDRPDLRLPGGRDARLLAAMERLLDAPGEIGGLEDLARKSGTSSRTLARLFSEETGLSFRDWRARAVFMQALERLEMGESSTALAAYLGYSSASAFVAAFRRHFGAPPSAYRRGG